jgi:hypothetical protein
VTALAVLLISMVEVSLILKDVTISGLIKAFVVWVNWIFIDVPVVFGNFMCIKVMVNFKVPATKIQLVIRVVAFFSMINLSVIRISVILDFDSINKEFPF